VCIPGIRYKLLVMLLRITPHWLIARFTRRHARAL
jgi:hypothetical protein